MHYKLPEVGGFDFGRRRAAVDDLCAYDELHVLASPVLWCLGFDGFHVAGLSEELAGGNGASASNTGDYDCQLAGVGIPKAGDDGVVAIVVCGFLHGAVDGPMRVRG